MREAFLKFLANDLVDTHCHLNDAVYDKNRTEIVKESNDRGVKRIIDVAVNIEASLKSLGISKEFPNKVFASIGIDQDILVPTSDLYTGEKTDKEFRNWLKESREALSQLISSNHPTMVGECGMDSYWLFKATKSGEISRSDMDISLSRQEKLFRMQCELAEQYQIPMTIHTRNYEKRSLEIVGDYKIFCIFHSFTSSYKVATQIIDKGHFLGVNGIVTYNSASELRELYRKLMGKPESEHLYPSWFYNKGVVFETDSPWLKPFEPKITNSPSSVAIIAESLFQYCKGL